jgi:hypothetical protein
VPLARITEHSAGQIVAQGAVLGFERTPDVVMLQIFTQSGRGQAAKQSLFASIARQLAGVGIAGGDIFIGYVENAAGDRSFGSGRAQYVTGEFGVPGR